MRRICQEAANGEPPALEALRVTGGYLAVGLANLVWGLDPDTIVISSSMEGIWPMLHDWIVEQFPPSDVWPTFRNLRVQPSVLGERGPLVGATLLPFAEAFQVGELARIGP